MAGALIRSPALATLGQSHQSSMAWLSVKVMKLQESAIRPQGTD